MIVFFYKKKKKELRLRKTKKISMCNNYKSLINNIDVAIENEKINKHNWEKINKLIFFYFALTF